MANLGKQIDVTTLDFDQIKANLISYFKEEENGKFSDWNFEGSNLNTIIDVLAYNTHYNAMLAHMAVNESYIDSAQLRSSVVSAAKLLGYIPRSRSSSQITFNISIPKKPNISNHPSEITVKGGIFDNNVSTLEAQNDSGDYSFTLRDDVILTLTGNNYIANGAIAYQGSLVTRSYAAIAYDTSATYEIIDENIDISSLKVRVYETSSSNNNLLFEPFNSSSTVTDKTPIYFINENIFGKYEISFGDGVFGKKLDAGNIIELEYIVTNGVVANNCSRIISQNLTVSDPSAIGIITTSALTLIGRSSGGKEKESISALKNNAISSFATQNRAVTSDDYTNLIKAKFGYINSISVWGGEDNVPPVYGKVFISANKIQSINGQSTLDNLSDADKAEILSYLQSKKVLSIFPEIVNPNTCNIVLDILVKYNPNITTLSRADISSRINDIITDYNINRINEFNSVFRHSQFVRAIEDSSNSILNSLVRVYLSQSFTLNDTNVNNITLNFGARCATDDGRVFINIVSDVPWILGDLELFFNEEQTSDKNIIKIYSYYIKDNKPVKYADAGTFNIETGIMTLNTLYSDSDVTFNFIVNSFSNDVIAKRNTLLEINQSLTSTNIFVDEIARGGNSRSVDYKTFPKDR